MPVGLKDVLRCAAGGAAPRHAPRSAPRRRRRRSTNATPPWSRQRPPTGQRDGLSDALRTAAPSSCVRSTCIHLLCSFVIGVAHPGSPGTRGSRGPGHRGRRRWAGFCVPRKYRRRVRRARREIPLTAGEGDQPSVSPR
ncbi:hypothetical protein QJS66_04160 [Kocuria rhizophila]|nr:hypothetical protein QJS66_04160 [Kocuria rhizophila]